MKGFEKNYVVYVHEKLGGQKNIRLIRDKNIKKKGPRMVSWDTPERKETSGKEKRGKELYMRTCCVQFVRNEQISERAEWDRLMA